MPWFWDLVQLSTEIPLQLPVSTTLLKQSHNYVLHTTRSSSTSPPGVWEWITPRTWILCGSGRENFCTSAVINKDHVQIKWALFEKIVQRTFGGFLHSICETNLRFMSTPLGGGYIIFAFFAVRCPASGVRCPASRMVSAHLKEKY